MGEKGIRLILFLSLLFLSLTLLMADIKGNTLRKEFPPLDWATGKAYFYLGEVKHKGWEGVAQLLKNVKIHLAPQGEIKRSLQAQEALKKKIQTLEKKLITYREAFQENKRLKVLLALKDLLGYKTIGAYPIEGVPSPWSHALIINVGKDEGIKEGSAVLNSDGVVGIVTEAHRERSTVMLITDPSFSIHVRDYRSRVIGVVKGTGTSLCTLHYVVADRDISPGDLLVTSGMGGVYPKGYPVGTVVKVEREPGELFMKAKVKPKVDLSRLGYLLVVLPQREKRR